MVCGPTLQSAPLDNMLHLSAQPVGMRVLERRKSLHISVFEIQNPEAMALDPMAAKYFEQCKYIYHGPKCT